MKPIVEIKSLSKKFRINHEQQPYLSLRDSVANMFRSRSAKEDFWALKDVSFDVMAGDTVGIIGKNGAGKSTLLKILSKITPPTSGKIILRGRIASLLEVGTGFHSELSGRENVFMNGSILGMRRAEILKNFDAIVDFAGVEKFIDTPLKHYSSGMQLRLAFAVAAFLENEILVIDEVLAVGDIEFQKKCMRKMEDVSRSGRTILFVSHDMSAIRELCRRAVLLNKGQVEKDGPTEEIVSAYFKNSATNLSLQERTDRTGNGLIRFTNLVFLNKQSVPVDTVFTNDPLKIELYYEAKNTVDTNELISAVVFQDAYQKPVMMFVSDEMKVVRASGEGNRIILEIDALPLRGGSYTVKLFSAYKTTAPQNFCDVIENAASINVLSTDFWGVGKKIRDEHSTVASSKFIYP